MSQKCSICGKELQNSQCKYCGTKYLREKKEHHKISKLLLFNLVLWSGMFVIGAISTYVNEEEQPVQQVQASETDAKNQESKNIYGNKEQNSNEKNKNAIDSSEMLQVEMTNTEKQIAEQQTVHFQTIYEESVQIEKEWAYLAKGEQHPEFIYFLESTFELPDAEDGIYTLFIRSETSNPERSFNSKIRKFEISNGTLVKDVKTSDADFEGIKMKEATVLAQVEPAIMKEVKSDQIYALLYKWEHGVDDFIATLKITKTGEVLLNTELFEDGEYLLVLDKYDDIPYDRSLLYLFQVENGELVKEIGTVTLPKKE